MKTESSAVDINRNIGDFFYPEAHVRDAGAGLSERTIHYISDVKEDPDWVREFRLRGLKTFLGPRRNAVGMKCRTTLSAHLSVLVFLSRSENFSLA
jgi:hypothetical protein